MDGYLMPQGQQKDFFPQVGLGAGGLATRAGCRHLCGEVAASRAASYCFPRVRTDYQVAMASGADAAALHHLDHFRGTGRDRVPLPHAVLDVGQDSPLVSLLGLSQPGMDRLMHRRRILGPGVRGLEEYLRRQVRGEALADVLRDFVFPQQDQSLKRAPRPGLFNEVN